MKLMSFNTQHCVNYLEQRVDYEIIAKTILDLDADIIGLNEMFDEGNTSEFGKQTEKLAKLTNIKSHYFARAIDDIAGPYGNGLLSKYPIKSAETIIIPDPYPKRVTGGFYETRCLLKAELENGITVLVTHFGLCIDEQENAVKTILKHLKSEKCILMGDFNIEPDSELLKPIREKMIDTATGNCENKMSWPSDEPKVKIDYIFVSPDLKVISADIPEIVSSDHRPHIAEIEIIK